MSQLMDLKMAEREEDTQKGKYLTFLMGEETYGIEICHVTEIIGIQPITEVVDLPSYIKGIINLRGKIIPVMDVRVRFNKPFREYVGRTGIIVIDTSGISIGLIVDSVSEVVAIPDDQIVPLPDIRSRGQKYIKGVGKVGDAVKLILNCDNLFGEEDMKSLALGQ